MYLDSHLSWEYHIKQLCKKLSQANGILAKLRHNAPLETVLLVYHAIFYSHLNYGCSIWDLTCDKHIEKIRKLQKRCMRIVIFSDFNSHTNPLFTDLKILKVDDVIKLILLKFIYEFKHDLSPSEISNIFESCTDIHNYNTRSTINQGLFIPVIVDLFFNSSKKMTIMTTSKQSHVVKHKYHLKGCELYHGYLQNMNFSIIPFLFHKSYLDRNST